MPAPDQSLLCPACGFDLRATTSDRCGECGLVIDRAALLHTAIPFAYRSRLGFLRGYLKTFWQFTLDRQSLRQEAAKPQSLADARIFRRITALLVAAALLIVLIAAVWVAGGPAALAIQPPSAPIPLHPATAGLLQDIVVPWIAGATFLPTLPLCFILLAFSVTGAAIRPPHARPISRTSTRARALALYAGAPLALILPALIFLFVPSILSEKYEQLNDFRAAILLSIALGSILYLFAVFTTLLRTAQWTLRTRHCSATRAAVASLELFALWLLAWLILLGLLPWAIGFCWIAFDSLR